ncbi:MAG: anion permease [Clostridiaceae bacterium]
MATLTGIDVSLGLMITIALIFTLTNGLHDASSVVATMISSRAATPRQAVLLASAAGLLGVLFSGNLVADTVSKIIITSPGADLLHILTAAILGAVIWNLFTWRLGLPSSSTHALIGGLIGAAWIYSGPGTILWGFQEFLAGGRLVGIAKVVAALLLSPILGFLIAFIVQKAANLLLRNAKFKINKSINRLQWIAAGALAFSYGANDSQKITGLITLALISEGIIGVQGVPVYIKLMVGFVMFFGTVFGGWRIMKTLGYRIYTMRPVHSLNSMLSSVTSILLATFTGAPVSTTHIVVGGIMGVGAADEYRMVNWKIGSEIVMAWFITMPCSAAFAAVIYYIINWRVL